MKKTLIFIFLFALSFVLVGCGKEEEVVKPKLTLDKMAELINSSNAVPAIKCNALDNNEIIGTIGDKVLLSNKYLYSILKEPGKQYSNGEQCMRYGDGVFNAIIGTNYLLGSDNKIYSSYDFKENSYYTNINGADVRDWVDLTFTESESAVYKSTNSYKNGTSTNTSYAKFYVLRTDGSIYLAIYKIQDKMVSQKKKTTVTLYKDKLMYSSEDYGYIEDFNVSGYGTNKEVDLIISKKGVFVLKQIETEECLKYEDVACEKRMSLITDYSYNKYKDQIKYYDKNIVITNNNSILDTKLVFNINGARKNYERLFEGFED